MPNYNYTTNIPLGTDNPTNSASQFNTNFNSIASIVNVDLYGFQNNFGGTHQQVTFPQKNPNNITTETDPQSALFTLSGTASSVADLQFLNQNALFPLSTLRVLGAFNSVGTTGPVSLNMGFNVTSVTSNGSGVSYTIALPANAITGTNVAVFANSSAGFSLQWSFSANTLTIQGNFGGLGKTISFAIYQI